MTLHVARACAGTSLRLLDLETLDAARELESAKAAFASANGVV
jgi:hypothetical protein